MQGTEKQIAYATKVRDSAAAAMAELASEFSEAVAEGLSPALQAQADVVADLSAKLHEIAETLKTTDDAAYILDHHKIGLSQVMYHHGFFTRFTDANRHTLNQF